MGALPKEGDVVLFTTIKMSIANWNRTNEDWREFRKIQKSMGSAVLLPIRQSPSLTNKL